ncbi:hypothetical protein PV327_008894 [Microctonus hyperodae]|uniref:Uncharacterized protein n=1 Tax=Microctonus hyperodae TaxID=165561 RepID=A0AA39FTC5_MICHY|nr:hypothetical protein PV327_008894 [Microctonus hyperodae]
MASAELFANDELAEPGIDPRSFTKTIIFVTTNNIDDYESNMSSSLNDSRIKNVNNDTPIVQVISKTEIRLEHLNESVWLDTDADQVRKIIFTFRFLTR